MIETAKFCSKKCKDKNNTIRIEADCLICGKHFEHISSRCNKAKYCSRRCYHRSQIGKGLTEYTCEHCGKKFNDSFSHPRKYCSIECVKKKYHTIWKPGFSYIRKAMKRRGMIESCELCGYKEFPQILGIHHKDENRKNNELSNLQVLCPNCHSIQHMKHTPH